jgi:hypothetical protein
MDIFDAQNKNWTLESGIESLQGLENLNNSPRLDIYEQIQSSKIEKCDIDIDKRIGMESTMAEVYKVSINKVKNLFMAAKVLPITSNESYNNNKREFEFAIEASNLVLKGKSPYFPLVYDIAFCKETHFHGIKNTSIKFHEKSLRYQQFQQLLDSTKDQKIKLKIVEYKRKFMNPDYVRDLLKLQDVKLSNKIASHILFSELASFDLGYYLDHHILKKRDLYLLLKHIFLAIQDMQLKLNLVHSDLHLGNIVLIKNDGKYLPLIHDFGKSRKIDFGKSRNYDLQHDIFYFIGKFEERIREVYEDSLSEISSILKYLDDIADVYYESKKEYPIVSVVEFWNSLKI